MFSRCLLGAVCSCCSTTDVFLCWVLKCLLTHANCTHTTCIYSQVFLKDRMLVRIRFVLAWCANAKHHSSGCRFESLTFRRCLKFLNCLMSIWLLMWKVSRLLPAVHKTKAAGTVKTLIMLAGSPKAEWAGGQNHYNRGGILAGLTSVGVLPWVTTGQRFNPEVVVPSCWESWCML